MFLLTHEWKDLWRSPFEPETGTDSSTTIPDTSRLTHGLDLTKQNCFSDSESVSEQSPRRPSERTRSAHSHSPSSSREIRSRQFLRRPEHSARLDSLKRPQRIESSLHRAEIETGRSEDRAVWDGEMNFNPDFPDRQCWI